MPDNEGKSNKDGAIWQVAIDMFSQVSGWVVGPIVLALIIGKSLDGHFGTKPIIFLALTGLAFLISSYGIVKVVSRYIKSIEKETEEKKNGNK